MRQAFNAQFIPTFDESDLFQKFAQGSLGGVYLTSSEFITLMNLVMTDYPEVVRSVDVGKSYLNKTIPGYLVGLNFNHENYKQEALKRPGLLINGAHHARELSTISMNAYTLLRLLFDYTKGD